MLTVVLTILFLQPEHAMDGLFSSLWHAPYTVEVLRDGAPAGLLMDDVMTRLAAAQLGSAECLLALHCAWGFAGGGGCAHAAEALLELLVNLVGTRGGIIMPFLAGGGI